MGHIQPRIIGTGTQLPELVRYNNDPVFERWQQQDDMFTGFKKRHCLRPDETLIDIMEPAARAALSDAAVEPEDIDILLGCGSISRFIVPNVLSDVHHRLGLRSDCWPIPLMNSFSQVPAAIMMADSLIRTGQARRALLVFGDNWTRHVDYTSAQAISAGDGAAALVLAHSDNANQWRFVDQMVEADTSYFGSMFMAAKELHLDGPMPDVELQSDSAYSQPYFQITSLGAKGFRAFGGDRAPKVAMRLLQKHGIAADKVCMVSHQASTQLTKGWSDQIGPGHYEDTLEEVGNLVLCSVAYNMSRLAKGAASYDWMLSLCLGPDMHASAALYARG